MSGDNGTHYFETLNRIHGELTEEVLIKRINECETVLNELMNSYVWQIVVKDAQAMVKMLDDNWQNMPPTDIKFTESRTIKIACKQIVDLPKKYLEELEMLKDKLGEIQNPETIIEKDADNQ